MALRLNDNLVGLEYVAAMLGIDALIALLLAAIGIFGVIAALVSERTREVGVRLAMGAQRIDILTMILRRASWLTGAGLAAGLVMTSAFAKVAANLLRGVKPYAPVVFVTITGAVAMVALPASWIPARHATKIDPLRALRSE